MDPNFFKPWRSILDGHTSVIYYVWCQYNSQKICCYKNGVVFCFPFLKTSVDFGVCTYIFTSILWCSRLLSNPVLCKAVIWKWKADAGFYYWMWSYVTCINDLLTLLGYVLATLKNFTVEKLSLFYYEMETKVPHITIF